MHCITSPLPGLAPNPLVIVVVLGQWLDLVILEGLFRA